MLPIQESKQIHVFGILIFMHVLSVDRCPTVDLGNRNNSFFFLKIFFSFGFEGSHQVEKFIIVLFLLDHRIKVRLFDGFLSTSISVLDYESTAVIPVFGTVDTIAHFKLGINNWIHIALVSMNIQVARKASKDKFV